MEARKEEKTCHLESNVAKESQPPLALLTTLGPNEGHTFTNNGQTFISFLPFEKRHGHQLNTQQGSNISPRVPPSTIAMSRLDAPLSIPIVLPLVAAQFQSRYPFKVIKAKESLSLPLSLSLL